MKTKKDHKTDKRFKDQTKTRRGVFYLTPTQYDRLEKYCKKNNTKIGLYIQDLLRPIIKD